VVESDAAAMPKLQGRTEVISAVIR
jgi:hypothetical protein